MRSSYEQRRASPPVLMRDPLAEHLIGASSGHARVRVSRQLAPTAGKSLVLFWRQCWRSL